MLMLGTITPGPGTLPDCPYGSWWNPQTGRCEELFTPASYTPQEPSAPQPVDPYGPDYQPPSLPQPVDSGGRKKWIIIGSLALAAVGLGAIVYAASRRSRR